MHEKESIKEKKERGARQRRRNARNTPNCPLGKPRDARNGAKGRIVARGKRVLRRKRVDESNTKKRQALTKATDKSREGEKHRYCKGDKGKRGGLKFRLYVLCGLVEKGVLDHIHVQAG